ncbi:MAG TPA: hypothetical protein VI687_00615 [Candidatus Limnocylindrales bacterium]|nr:hypothetical protein [Candidatus Limnocylindrales bacterium]
MSSTLLTNRHHGSCSAGTLVREEDAPVTPFHVSAQPHPNEVALVVDRVMGRAASGR